MTNEFYLLRSNCEKIIFFQIAFTKLCSRKLTTKMRHYCGVKRTIYWFAYIYVLLKKHHFQSFSQISQAFSQMTNKGNIKIYTKQISYRNISLWSNTNVHFWSFKFSRKRKSSTKVTCFCSSIKELVCPVLHRLGLSKMFIVHQCYFLTMMKLTLRC